MRKLTRHGCFSHSKILTSSGRSGVPGFPGSGVPGFRVSGVSGGSGVSGVSPKA